VVDSVPKSLAPVAGRPFLEYLFAHWATQEVSGFIVSTGYLGSQVKEFLGGSFRGLPIQFVHEQRPLGTGGALLKAIVEIRSPDCLVVVNGDTWFPIELTKLISRAVESAAPAVVGLSQTTDNERYSTVELASSGLVTKFHDDRKAQGYINAGVYLFSPDLLKSLVARYPDTFSLEHSLLPDLVRNGLLAGVPCKDCPFLDIGVPEAYKAAEAYMGKILE